MRVPLPSVVYVSADASLTVSWAWQTQVLAAAPSVHCAASNFGLPFAPAVRTWSIYEHIEKDEAASGHWFK